MRNTSPIISKPDAWSVTQDSTYPVSLSPLVAAKVRYMRTDCSFQGCELHLEVPTDWPVDYTDQVIGKLRNWMSQRRK